MDAITLPEHHLRVLYAGRNISADISGALLELTYTDVLEGESDSVEIVLEDAERRWQGAWYPQHGDALDVSLTLTGAPDLVCGRFEIDELELDGPPDVVRIKALAAGVKRSVRTHKGRAWENTTLEAICRDVATRNRLMPKLAVQAVAIRYAAQAFETDLGFLHRLCAQYGHSATVRGDALVVVRRADLKAAAPVLLIRRQDVVRWRFRDKVHGIYTESRASYHDPHSKSPRRGQGKEPAGPSSRHSADTLKINVRAESDGQAQLKADAALDRANEDQTGATLTLIGSTRLMAGVNVALQDFGQMDGRYTVHVGRHSVSRSAGYATEIELKRVRT